MSGSPPRARGRRSHGGQLPSSRRFTPACAGTATGQMTETRRCTVHPRVRGDGSSWGASTRRWRRFTPACAGTAYQARPLPRGLPVHPRVRGDGGITIGAASIAVRFTPACAGTARLGSLRRFRFPVHPRVRGDGEPCDRDLAVEVRFTPACAGTALADAIVLYQATGSPPRARGRLRNSATRSLLSTVHPRVRGDGGGWAADFDYLDGSPPRARGRRSRRPSPSWSPAVHPRVRGDGPVCAHVIPRVAGSPPRARGRRVRFDRARPAQRFTPACAGTASGSSVRCCRSTVHPRVRGDGGGVARVRSGVFGSPPRARGRPPVRLRRSRG